MNIRQAEKIRKAYSEKIEAHIGLLKEDGYKKIIIVNGFPKSGNTWLCRLLSSYWKCPVAGYLGNPSAREVAATGNNNSSETLCILKSHHMPSSLKALGENVQILHIIRDPRDVAVSAAAYFNGRGFYSKSLRFVTLAKTALKLAQTKPGYPTWWSAGWGGYHSEVLEGSAPYVCYEALLKRQMAGLENFIAEVDGRTDKSRLESAFEENTFENIKKKHRDSVNQVHLRSGKEGEHTKLLPSLLRRLIVARTGDVMRAFNYETPQSGRK